MFLDYFALGVLIFVGVTLFYAVIAIHDIPYEIAKHRDHPHQDAIHVAGWVSLFTLHVLWPFLWIWAMLFRPDRGWGIGGQGEALLERSAVIKQLEERIAELERRLPGEPPGQRVVAPNPEPPMAERMAQIKAELTQPVEKR